jgi:hypothetical protein
VISQAKDDDTVEAQTTQDIKQSQELLLKKGSTLVGHILSVQPPTAEKPEYYVVILFDRVRPKNGEEIRFNLVIQALAPESDMESRSIAEATGIGIERDVPGLQPGDRTSEGKHYTVLATSGKDVDACTSNGEGINVALCCAGMAAHPRIPRGVQLKKGTELVSARDSPNP